MNGFDFINYQKQFLDAAVNASKQFLNTQEKTEEKNFFENLYNQQLNWFKQMSGNTDLKDMALPTPENLKKWFDLQADLLKKYSDFASKTVKTDFSSFAHPFTDKAFLPVNLESVFQTMQKSWEAIQKSIKFNMFEPSAMSHLFGESQLKDSISKMLGFNAFSNFNDPIKEAESFFNNWIEAFQKGGEQVNELMKGAGYSGIPSFTNGYSVGVFDNLLELINKNLSQNFGTWQRIFPVKERDEVINAIKNVQFSYLAYLYKSNAMQAMLIEKGSNAMPETIKYFSEHHSKEGNLPDYEAFFHKYIEILEHNLIETLNTPEYSKVQSSVANALVTTKKQVEELKVLIFDGLPFVKYAEFDDLLLEISTLKRKNRQLEARLSAIEQKLPKK